MEFFDILVSIFSILFMVVFLVMIVVYFFKYIKYDREFKRIQKHYYEVMIDKFEDKNKKNESEDL